LHPVIIKGDYIAIGSEVFDKRDCYTLVFFKAVGELKDISDCGATETVKALVVVAYYADVAGMGAEEEDKLLLYVVGVLVFVNHQVFNFVLDFIEDVRIVFQEGEGFGLQAGKVHEVFGIKYGVVLFHCFAQGGNVGSAIGLEGFDVNEFFGEVIDIGTKDFGLIPYAYVVGYYQRKIVD
jgi:hypothetical protein